MSDEFSKEGIVIICDKSRLSKEIFSFIFPSLPSPQLCSQQLPILENESNAMVAYIYIYFPPLAPPVAVLKLFLGVVVVSVGLGLGRRVVENTVPGRSSH